jgi:HEPN domain-containing protein
MLRRDFQTLSMVRIREAKALAKARLFDGAFYLGGLAVESALKSAIARETQRYEFPDLRRVQRAYTHNLDELLRLAGLEPHLAAAGPAIVESWTKARIWNVDTRYRVGRSAAEVLDFLRAVAGRHGVQPWLKQFW